MSSAACFVWASELQGQSAGPAVEVDSRPSFGFWFGGESVPAGLDRTCWETTGRRTMALLGAFAVIPVGPIGLEGRVGGHWRSSVDSCLLIGELLQPGTHTERSPAVPAGSFASLDLRARWAPSDEAPWFVAAGAGWAASAKDVPYVIMSVAVRSLAQAVHFGVDLDLAFYRVPWTERTVQVAADGSAMELSRRNLAEWARAVGVRFSIELPVVRE